jgi:hypothetical protein
MRLWAGIASAVLVTLLGWSGARAAGCDREGVVRFICGMVSPEDLVSVPGTDWIIVSGYETGGALHVVNARSDQTVQVFPTGSPRVRPDARTYPDCLTPLDPAEKEKFSAHGLNVGPGRNGLHMLYMVHHGFRESIEVFEIDTKPATPTFTWVGCVVAPDTESLNGVAPLPGGGFVATSNYPRGDEDARFRAQAGMNTGEIWEWHTKSGWKVVPGSESPGPNGIEVSKDGTWLYVNMWPVRKFMRLSRGQSPVKKDVIDLPFHPDNLRWQKDGSLLSAGHYAPTSKRATECLRTMCADASAKVARIDPATLKIREVVNYPSTDAFFGATAALQVGKEIWIGSVRGDRVARYPID